MTKKLRAWQAWEILGTKNGLTSEVTTPRDRKTLACAGKWIPHQNGGFYASVQRRHAANVCPQLNQYGEGGLGAGRGGSKSTDVTDGMQAGRLGGIWGDSGSHPRIVLVSAGDLVAILESSVRAVQRGKPASGSACEPDSLPLPR